jgi:hypothetical protein
MVVHSDRYLPDLQCATERHYRRPGCGPLEWKKKNVGVRQAGGVSGRTQTVVGSYLTRVNQGWVSELSHAAYLGKELEKAALSLQSGFRYVQDAA